MWVIKTHGETFYVNHVSANIPWTTKETPNSSHTKGSLKFKECLLTIDNENNANITHLSQSEKARIKNKQLGITRIITKAGETLKKVLEHHSIEHGPIKSLRAVCSSTYYVTDIYNQQDMTMLTLLMANNNFRILMPNEDYYKIYDAPENAGKVDIDLDGEDDYDEEE